jgi:hypothetical protein
MFKESLEMAGSAWNSRHRSSDMDYVLVECAKLKHKLIEYVNSENWTALLQRQVLTITVRATLLNGYFCFTGTLQGHVYIAGHTRETRAGTYATYYDFTSVTDSYLRSYGANPENEPSVQVD